jgi:D-aminopeptidase
MMSAVRQRLRDLGYAVGRFHPGPRNSLIDVAGVRVGHATLIEGDSVRTGVTAVLPHSDNPYTEKVFAACHVVNGYGKAAGLSQLEELGTLESPILLTSTVSVGPVWEGGLRWLLDLNPEAAVDRDTVNVVVGECFDGWLNDSRGLHVRPEHALEAIAAAGADEIAEGPVGAGTGTTCFGFKSGVGCSSRLTGEGAEYVLAFSTARRLAHRSDDPYEDHRFLRDDSRAMRELFEAAVEVTAEAVWNSLCSADAVEGRDGNRAEALPYELLERAPGLTRVS